MQRTEDIHVVSGARLLFPLPLVSSVMLSDVCETRTARRRSRRGLWPSPSSTTVVDAKACINTG